MMAWILLAVMAGDNQMDPAFLPALLDPIVDGKCDYTMGNRLDQPDLPEADEQMAVLRQLLSSHFLTKIASGYWQMMDPQNGYTAISKRALERISLEDIYPRYGYCNDLLVKLNVIGFQGDQCSPPGTLRQREIRNKIQQLYLEMYPISFFMISSGVSK